MMGWMTDWHWHGWKWTWYDMIGVSFVYFSSSRFPFYHGWRDYPPSTPWVDCLHCFALRYFLILPFLSLLLVLVGTITRITVFFHLRLNQSLGIEVRREGTKSYYFSFVMFLLSQGEGGLSAFLLFLCLFCSLTKLRDPWCYDLTG